MSDGRAIGEQVRAFIRALFALAEPDARPKPAQQFLIPHPPVRKD